MPSLAENKTSNGTTASTGKIIYVKPKQEFVMDRGIGDIIFDGIKVFSDNTAQINAATGEKESYATLNSKSIRIAQNLRLKCVKPGDVISMLTYNNMDYTGAVLASFYVGAINAPMDPTSPLLDITHCLRITTPKVVFCEEELEEIVEKAVKDADFLPEIVVFGKTERNVPFTDYLIPHPEEFEEDFEIHKVTDYKSTACIHFSSGTTGSPKAVCVTHYGLGFVTFLLEGNFKMTKTTMIVTSPFWISNMNQLVLGILCGDTRVICKMFNETNIMKYIQDYKINVLTITPVNGAVLLSHPEYCEGYDASSLKALATGGSPTNPKQFLGYTKMFPDAVIIGGYGMTETGGIILGIAPQKPEELAKQKKACVGTPIPSFQYKIVDPETEEILGPNQEGEMRVKYEGLMNNYYNNPKAYTDAFDKEGFLKTGDILYYDEDYRFFYVTRIKDIFKYKGWHISPLLIEQELAKHPNVQQAVVFGVPTEKEGEYPTAAVILKDKVNFNVQDLVKLVEDSLPDKYHIRGGVYVVDRMPTTSTGKLQRIKLTEMVLNTL